MPLLVQEAVDVVAIYFGCLLRHPQTRWYDSRMFNTSANRFRTTRGVLGQIHRRQSIRRIEENITNVLAYVHSNFQLGVRVISGKLGIPQTPVLRIQKEGSCFLSVFSKITLFESLVVGRKSCVFKYMYVSLRLIYIFGNKFSKNFINKLVNIVPSSRLCDIGVGNDNTIEI